jgi:hypothetical protein
MRQASDRLSVYWYVGHDLGEPLPDHSSLTRIRTRYGVKVFCRFFEAIVDQCQQAGLVWGKELYADALRLLWRVNIEALMKAAGQISSGCSRSEDGDAVRFQQRPCMPSFWLYVACLSILQASHCVVECGSRGSF